MHGSPYAYDTWVPVIALGQGIPRGTVERRVTPLAIAATIAALHGVAPPPEAEAPLAEALGETVAADRGD
jgi:hypothetical protein